MRSPLTTDDDDFVDRGRGRGRGRDSRPGLNDFFHADGWNGKNR